MVLDEERAADNYQKNEQNQDRAGRCEAIVSSGCCHEIILLQKRIYGGYGSNIWPDYTVCLDGSLSGETWAMEIVPLNKV
ncbi:hypothetical protein D3C73_1436160 [compost metagenome]